MLRSVAVESKSPIGAFLTALQTDLSKFGREDVRLVNVGNMTVFVWDRKFVGVASEHLRRLALQRRLVGRKTALQSVEAMLPADYFTPFDLDFDKIDPEIVSCERKSGDERLFNYVAEGQSLPAETSKMRIGKFLVYDRGGATRRLLGIIGLKSPMYFDGARDRHLGWPPIHLYDGNTRRKNDEGIQLRNQALKSIYNICVCMPAPPYDKPKIGSLLGALCFSDPVITYLERTYGDPVLGLTTTGGWGGSAAQYAQAKLPSLSINRLYTKTRGTSESLAHPFNIFSDEVVRLAYEAVKASRLKSRQLVPPADASTTQLTALRRQTLLMACRVAGVHRSVLATNSVAHYFGAISGECRGALANVTTLLQPPPVRSVAIAPILSDWLAQNANLSNLKNVAATPLSTIAS